MSQPIPTWRRAGHRGREEPRQQLRAAHLHHARGVRGRGVEDRVVERGARLAEPRGRDVRHRLRGGEHAGSGTGGDVFRWGLRRHPQRNRREDQRNDRERAFRHGRKGKGSPEAPGAWCDACYDVTVASFDDARMLR